MTVTRRYVLYAVLTALSPLLVSVLLLGLTQGKTFFDYLPSFGDAIYHWHQPASFARGDFNVGYYTTDEAVARAAFSPYYAWSLAGPVSYGLLAKVTGWTFYTGILMDAVLMVLAVAAFLWMVRPAPKDMLLLALLLAVNPVLLIYLPLMMQEAPNMAVMLIMAGGFYRLLAGTASPRVKVVLALAILFACWMRPTYGVFWLPFWWFVLRRPFWTLVLSVLITGIMYMLYDTTGAPYIFPLSIIINVFKEALQADGLGAAVQQGALYYNSHLRANLEQLGRGEFIEVATRMIVFALAIAVLWTSLKARFNRALRHEMRVHTVNLWGAVLLALLLYNIGDLIDFRFFAPYIVFSVGLFVAFQRRRWLYVLLGVYVVLLPFTLSVYLPMMQESYRTFQREDVDQWAATWHDAGVQYNPDVPSYWCNSVTYSFEYLFEPEKLIAFEPGIGISFLRYWATQKLYPPLQARYLLLKAKDAANYPNPDALRPLWEGEDETLFENTATVCS